MKRENPMWGAPRIDGELLLLGFEISEPTVSRYLQQLKRIPEGRKASQWLAFLNDHREVIAAFDLFAVPTPSQPYVASSRLNTIAGAFCISTLPYIPTSDRIVQQLREAFPLPCPYRYVLFDH